MTAGPPALRLPRIGIGAMTWGDPRAIPRLHLPRLAYGLAESREEEERAVALCQAAGANLIDTAAMYGRGESERRVGELTRGRDVLVATKFPLSVLSGTGSFHRDLAGSLARLGRATIDLYQVHYPFPWMPIPRLMDLMAGAVESGRVRAVGVSNFGAAQMRQAHEILARRGIPLASNQVQYSLLWRRPEVDGVLDACRELGVALIAYMPLASGALTGKYSAASRPAGLRRGMGRFRFGGAGALGEVLVLLQRIAASRGRSPGQVALRWLVERGALPIPGVKNGEQARQAAGVLEFSLAPAEVEALDRASAAWRR